MVEELRLVETREKSRVVTFRLGESVYSALEQQAQETGGTVSATARRLLLESLKNDEMVFKPGDTLKAAGSNYVVLLGNEEMKMGELVKRLDELGVYKMGEVKAIFAPARESQP